MKKGLLLIAVLAVVVYTANAWSQDPSLVLNDGGIQFPDGTIQNSALVGFAPVADTGQDKCWDATGAQIPCPGTGEDGELQAGVDWPAPRFTDQGNGTVKDNLTGLIWLQDAECFGVRIWADALSDADGLMSGSCSLTDGSVAGDWRLPNVKELSSLIAFGESSPALPSGHPFSNVLPAQYWSSSSWVTVLNHAWGVDMDTGVVVSFHKSIVSIFVWPVRGGQ